MKITPVEDHEKVILDFHLFFTVLILNTMKGRVVNTQCLSVSYSRLLCCLNMFLQDFILETLYKPGKDEGADTGLCNKTFKAFNPVSGSSSSQLLYFLRLLFFYCLNEKIQDESSMV